VGLAKNSIVVRSTFEMSAVRSGDDHPREKNGSEQTVLETGYVADEDISVTR
jgi:hypothetical protein